TIGLERSSARTASARSLRTESTWTRSCGTVATGATPRRRSSVSAPAPIRDHQPNQAAFVTCGRRARAGQDEKREPIAQTRSHALLVAGAGQNLRLGNTDSTNAQVFFGCGPSPDMSHSAARKPASLIQLGIAMGIALALTFALSARTAS